MGDFDSCFACLSWCSTLARLIWSGVNGGRRTCRSNKRAKASAKRRPRFICSEYKIRPRSHRPADGRTHARCELCCAKTCTTGHTLPPAATLAIQRNAHRLEQTDRRSQLQCTRRDEKECLPVSNHGNSSQNFIRIFLRVKSDRRRSCICNSTNSKNRVLLNATKSKK